jgi:hypothetical protein
MMLQLTAENSTSRNIIAITESTRQAHNLHLLQDSWMPQQVVNVHE